MNDMNVEGDYFKFEDRYTFAGPKEELDKLASVKWSMISVQQLTDDSIVELHTPLRYSDNSFSVEAMILQPIEDYIGHIEPQ